MTLNGAIDQLYTDMAGRHRVRAPEIQIIKTAIVPPHKCVRTNTKQFHVRLLLPFFSCLRCFNERLTLNVVACGACCRIPTSPSRCPTKSFDRTRSPCAPPSSTSDQPLQCFKGSGQCPSFLSLLFFPFIMASKTPSVFLGRPHPPLHYTSCSPYFFV